MASRCEACSGKPITTPFCSMCGRRIADDVTVLLTYLKQHQENAAGEVLRVKNRLKDTTGALQSRFEKRLQNAERTLAKWTAWVQALESLLERAAPER